MILIISKAIFLLIWLHTISLCFVWKKKPFMFRIFYFQKQVWHVAYSFFKLYLPTNNGAAIWYVKLVFNNIIIHVKSRCKMFVHDNNNAFAIVLCVEKKPFGAFLVMYPDVNLNITQNDRNVTSPLQCFSKCILS